MSEILYGNSGRRYVLGSRIGAGGEGIAWETDDGQSVVKIYDTSKQSVLSRIRELEQKINYMVKMNVPTHDAAGYVIVAWPTDALYQDGKFVGYVMPRITNAKPIYMINRGGSSARAIIPTYNWKNAATIAANLASLVAYLHRNNVIIGDMNSNNILVNAVGRVSIIDADSFDITDKTAGKHYRCSVGTEEYLPPELQGRNLSREEVRYSQNADEFALAVHIFQLLMGNQHPFNAKVITEYKQSLSENNVNYNISVGNCPYVKKTANLDIPPSAPVMEQLLPDYLVRDFNRTFNYSLDEKDPNYWNNLIQIAHRRTPAAVWHEDLVKLITEPALTRCSVQPEHYYLSSKGHCELCAAKQRMLSFLQNSQGDKPQTRQTPQTPQTPKTSKIPKIPKIPKMPKTPKAPKTISNTSAVQKSRWGKNKKVFIITVVLIAFFIVAFALFADAAYYYDAPEDYNSGDDVPVVRKFDDLGAYITKSYSNDNPTAYRCLNELKCRDLDVEKEYHGLYDWHLTEAFVNTGEEDHTQKMYSISRDETWYAHFRLEGGTPGEKRGDCPLQRFNRALEDGHAHDER